MANQQVAPFVGELMGMQQKFNKASVSNIAFQQEVVFAIQAIEKNDFSVRVAQQNPVSLRQAFIQTAAVGLSLNPALAYAYLVPRDGRIILDISYRGLIKIATDIGSVKWVKAELVYANDGFTYHGPCTMPDHNFDPFASEQQRGQFRGAYCIAKLPNGDILVDAMSAEDIYKVRDKSMAYARKQAGPWVDWFSEMVKKTIIKRASKTWPKSDPRLESAIHYLNEQAGEGLAELAQKAQQPHHSEPEKVQEIVVAADELPEVTDQVANLVTRLIQRAKAQGSWEAAVEYAKDRFKGDDLVYATSVIRNAQSDAANAA